MEVTKLCKGPCGMQLPLSHFWRDQAKPGGRCPRCVTCERKYRRGLRTPSDGPSEEGDRKRNPGQSWLYVMSYSFDVDGEIFGFKIGRAGCVDTRARDLACSHPFEMIVHARFQSSGHLEHALHEHFAEARVQGHSAREWFRVSLDAILEKVLELRRGTRSSGQELGAAASENHGGGGGPGLAQPARAAPATPPSALPREASGHAGGGSDSDGSPGFGGQAREEWQLHAPLMDCKGVCGHCEP